MTAAKAARITLRQARTSDARRLFTLVEANKAEGHLLPRTLAEITQHAERFVVAVRNRRIVGCAELAALSPQVAEVRSLAVDPSARSLGVGTKIVDELRTRARREGFDKLSAFTHVPGYFMPMGFSIRAPPVGRREGVHGLREVPAVPALRPVRDGAAARDCRRHRRPQRDTVRQTRMTTHTLRTLATFEGGVTTALGFRAAGVHIGIKAAGRGPDLALIVSDRAATAAAVFTTNRAQAAPVVVSREHLVSSGGIARAIIVNSGCANACTGAVGLQDAREMATLTGALIGCPTDQVLVASTGVIGVNLKMDRVREGVPKAASALGADQGSAAAQAIMTTDPFPKEAAARVTIGGRDVTVGGTAKGSGMIEPMMATMLAFVTTDAAVAQPLLQRALREVTDDTFNAITVDGECSTNDCVMMLANGASGVTIDDASYDAFVQAVRAVCLRLAIGIVRGGEGATKLVTVTVTGAASTDDARRCAKAIANSPLVKTAIHGGDPNWGRLVAVAGRAGVAFELERAAVSIGSIVLFKDGKPYDEGAPAAAEYLKRHAEIAVGVDLGAGTASSTVWTCDLSAEYVRINAEYRT